MVRQAMTHTIALLNMKGGVGKTTLAVNLADYTYKFRKKRVLLVDLDPQFNASQYLMDYKKYEKHRKEKGTIADLLIDQPKLALNKRRKKISSTQSHTARIYHTKSEYYFDFLPAELALSHVVKNPAQMEYRLEKILGQVRHMYDYIFIDCAPTDSVLTTMALTAADYLIIPIRPDRFSILGYANLLQTVAEFKANTSDPHKVSALGLIFTQVRGNSRSESSCIKDIENLAKKDDIFIFPSSLKFSNTFLTAVQKQTPISETKYARDELKQSIADIVDDLESRIGSIT